MDEPVHKKPLSDSVITRAKVPESPQANESRLKHSKTDCNKEKTKGQNETGNGQLKADETETKSETDKNEPMEEGEAHDTRQRHLSDMETAESKLYQTSVPHIDSAMCNTMQSVYTLPNMGRILFLICEEYSS